MIDIGPKFYTVPFQPLHDLKVKVMDFMPKVFRTSLFPNPVMYLVYTSVSDVFMRSSSLIQALLLWCCLQWHNARLYSVFLDVASCHWKSYIKKPVHKSWRYESVVLTNRIAGKRLNVKKIKLLRSNVPTPLHDLKVKVTVLKAWGLSFKF